MDLVKIFKYIIGINVLVVLLFFVILVGVKIYNNSNNFNIEQNIDPGFLSETQEEYNYENNFQLEIKLQEIVDLNDVTRCNDLVEEMFIKNCIDRINMNNIVKDLDFSGCKIMDGSLVTKEECERQIIFSKALEREDIKYCEETDNTDLYNQCVDTFYISLALKNNDIKYCSEYEKEERQVICKNLFLIEKILFNVKGDYNCDDFIGDNIRKDCKIAIEMKNIQEDNCEGFESSLFLDYCFHSF